MGGVGGGVGKGWGWGGLCAKPLSKPKLCCCQLNLYEHT